MKKRLPTVLFLALAASLTLTACSQNLTPKTSASFAVSEAITVTEEAEAEPMEMGAALNTAAGQIESSDALTAVPTSRKLIRTVDMDLETTDFDNMITSLNQTVTSMGGYVEESGISGRSLYSNDHATRFAHLKVRIPSNDLDAFISQIGTIGNVTNRSEQVRDVTLSYSDIESHKKSLTIEQERLWELLEKAESVDTVIALESRLSEIRYQLESYESQLRTFDNQIDYSTVTLAIHEVTVLTPTAPDNIASRIQKGFQKNLQNIGLDFTNLFVWFVASIPFFLIWGAVILLCLFIGKRIMKAIHKKKDNHHSEDAQ